MPFVQMYSTKKLPTREFKLTGDPYELKSVQEELRDLGVFYLRDDSHVQPVYDKTIVPPPLSPVFYHQCYLTDDWEIDEWSEPDPKVVEKRGDALSWSWFNKEATFVRMAYPNIVSQR